MGIRKIIVSCISLLFLSTTSFADPFSPQADYTVCFTPGTDCTANVVDALNKAQHDIWVQAYSFTSRPIGSALVRAKGRGVQVKIIFDKIAVKGPQGTIRYFARHGIPIWIDSNPNIAHNKVMIIDQSQVITGSFNFTRAAQEKNAENVLLIKDSGLAKKYLQNWQKRQQDSTLYVNDKYKSPQEWKAKESRLMPAWLKNWFGH